MKLEYSDAEKSRKLNTAVEIICALILGSACFYMFISMFGLSYSPDTMFQGSFGQGIAGIWDSIADTMGQISYTILPKYKIDLAEGGKAEYGAALTSILLMFVLISFFIIKSRIRLLLLLLAVPVCVLIAWFGVMPSVYAGAVFAAAMIIVLAVMSIGGKMKPAYFIVPLAAVLAGAAVTAALENTVSLDEPKALSDRGKAMQESIVRMRYGSDVLPEGDLGSLSGKELKEARGDIGTVKSLLGSSGVANSTGSDDVAVASADDDTAKGEGTETALTVKMSEPDSYYLRGFVGATYEKNRWNTISSGAFYGMRDEMFWLNRRGFDGLSELAYSQELTGEEQSGNKITVTVDSASRKIAFTPYELMLKPASGEKARKSEMQLPSGTKNYGGSFLGNEGVTGQKKYSYTAAPNITGVWTDAVGKFYTTTVNDDINKYFISESHYNVDVYERYLDIPDKLVEAINKEIGAPGDISTDHADYKEAIDAISGYMKEKYIYSETFSEPEKNADFVESFIQAKKGCDVHFATLAALMFRYYGIPARYVEGYLVSPAQVEGASSDTEIKVPKAANHAWTELYIDGFGWIPFEATPEYSGIMKEADLTKGLQNVDYESLENNRVNAEEEEPVEEENEEKDELGKLLILILKIVLIAIVSLILLLILLKIGMAVYAMIRWRRAFADKDPKAGIRALYQYTAVKNWKLSETGENIGLTASYSTYAMQESDRTRMRKEVDKAKERAKSEKSISDNKKSDDKNESGKGKGKDENK